MPEPQRDPATGKFLPTNAQPPAPPAEAAAGETPPPPPPEKSEKPKADTAGLQALAKSFLGEEPSVAPKRPAKAAPAKPAETPPKPKAAAVPPKPKPVTPPPAPAMTADQIAAATAEGVARGLAASKKEERTTAAADAPKLTESQQRRFEVLSHMEKITGEKYKGVADQYKASVGKLAKYASEWESEHPGEEFDAESAEHEEFFKKNNLFESWEEEDYTEALADLRAEKKLAEREKPLKAQISEIERKEKLRDSGPDIDREQVNAGQAFWKALGDDYADLLNERGVLNGPKAQELQQADPVYFSIRLQAAANLDVEIAELYKVMNGLEPFVAEPPRRGDAKYEQKLNQYTLHQTLSQFALTKEEELAKKPAEEKLNDKGQSFLTAAEYYKLPPERQSAHWTFSATDLAVLRAADLAATVQDFIEKREEEHKKWAEARGIKLPTNPQGSRQPPKPKPAAAQGADNGEVQSPTAGNMSRLAAGKVKRGQENQTPLNTFALRGID